MARLVPALLVASMIVQPAATLAEAAPPTEEEAAVVVGDEESVVSENADASAGSGWNARAIALRKVGADSAFVRQSSEAFVDADERLSLELKYFFELPADAVTDASATNDGPLTRGPKQAPGAKLVVGSEAAAKPWAAALPLGLDAQAPGNGIDVEWLDYQAGAKPKLIAALLPIANAEKEPTTALVVMRVTPQANGLQIEKQLASREIVAAELPKDIAPGGLLDTWDRPKSLGSRGMFFGRVIALLKLIDDRYAVDFYGEALNSESDCRVWLWRQGNPLGRPVNIRFVEVPVKKGPDAVGKVWALAVTVRGADDSLRTIAFDYPLCRPAVMAQLQSADPQASTDGKAAPAPDLEKLVGADLLDEFARRLVNGTYR